MTGQLFVIHSINMAFKKKINKWIKSGRNKSLLKESYKKSCLQFATNPVGETVNIKKEMIW